MNANDSNSGLKPAQSQPRSIILRLAYEYGLTDERSQRALIRIETIALCFHPSQEEKDIDAGVCESLMSSGAQILQGPGSRLWRVVGVYSKKVAVLDVTMGAVEWSPSEREEEAFERVADLARQAGQRAAASAGAIGWRRVEDVQAAGSLIDRARLALEDFQGLWEALSLREELGDQAKAGAWAPSRHAL
jgi:hypothetical protein